MAGGRRSCCHAPASGRAGVVRFPVALGPHASWDVRIDVAVSLDGEVEHPEQVERRFGTERARVRESLDAWSLRLPRLSTTSDELRHSFDQSVADLAALRLRAGEGPGHLPAAGMPWFMTVFGRDTIVTSLQTMLLGPELAVSALEALADLQADVRRPDDRRRAGEDPPRAPRRACSGEVVRALLRDRRRDAAVPRPPLGGLALDGRPGARAAASRARAGCPCLDRRLRRPRRRRLRRVPAALQRAREPVVEGLGRLAALPRRPLRRASHRAGRGAGLRLRREEAAGRGRTPRVGRRAARGPARARGRRAGRPLRRRRSGSPERGGYYALALDRDKQGSTRSAPTSATCSGAASSPRTRVEPIVDALARNELWSGWGVRTMSKSDAAYSPLSYHNGTVWPHDTALAAWGSPGTGGGPTCAASRWRSSRPPATSTGRSRRSSPASTGRRPPSRSRIRRQRGRRPGPPARRILLLRLLLGLEPDLAQRQARNARRGRADPWDRRSSSRAFGRSDGRGTSRVAPGI